ARHANMLYRAGFIREGHELARRAIRIDPFSPDSHRMMFIGALASNDLDSAQEYLRLIEELTGARETVYATLFFAVRQDWDKAAAILREDGWMDFASREKWFDTMMDTLEGRMPAEEFGRLFRDLEEDGEIEPVTAVSIYSLVGLPEEALRCLSGLESLMLMDNTVWLPIYDEMRALPGFPAAMAKHGVVELWEERGMPQGIRAAPPS
ncbi:MAG: hypothetical protein P8X98_17200, partial [Woeseiaceae bacterium]